MTYKKNIGIDPRIFYVLSGGNDAQDGNSLETAKRTFAGAFTAIAALSPPVGANDRAGIIIGDSATYNEPFNVPNYTTFDAGNSINLTSTAVTSVGTGTMSKFGVVECTVNNSAAILISNATDVSLNCTEILCNAEGVSGVSAFGTVENVIANIDQIRLIGDASIGVLGVSIGANQPETFNVNSMLFEGDNCIGVRHDTISPDARTVVNCRSMIELGGASGGTAVSVNNGHVTCIIDEINVENAITITNGTANVTSRVVNGDITVGAGTTLYAAIDEFSGTIVNNGTIVGRIGDKFLYDRDDAIELFIVGNTQTTDIPAIGAKVMINTDQWTAREFDNFSLSGLNQVQYDGIQDILIRFNGHSYSQSIANIDYSCQPVIQELEDFTVTFDNSTNTVVETSHGLSNGDNITFNENAGTLPAELRNDVVYFVVNTTANNFQLSYTEGGTAISFTDDGSGTNTYRVCNLIGSIYESVTDTPDGTKPMVYQGIGMMSKGYKTFPVVTNEENTLNLDVLNGYYNVTSTG